MAGAKITQAGLAAGTGMARSSVSQYLSGGHVPSRKNLKLFAAALGVSEDYLLGLEPDMPDPIPLRKILPEHAAKCMGKQVKFVKKKIIDGEFKFGSAEKFSSKWNFYINPVQFRDFVGADAFDAYFGKGEAR
jgi:transcriptional regulator with XRE-family HTH domain